MLHRNRALLLVQTELVLVLDGDLLPQVAQTTTCCSCLSAQN